jgi:two-component system, response regulator PdtaR
MLDRTGYVTYSSSMMPRAATSTLPKPSPRCTIVEFRLPSLRLLPGTSPGMPGETEEPQAVRLKGASGRPLRVLIVDDDPAVASVLEDMVIEGGGESAGIITSALAAIGAAAVIAPDVVLMDVRLPGAMDGIEAAGIIRVRGSAAVVIITGAAVDPELHARLKALEGVEVIFKPVLEIELCGAILRAYGTR